MLNYDTKDADVIIDGNNTYHPKQTLEVLRQLVEAMRWRTKEFGDKEYLTSHELTAFNNADALLKEYKQSQ